MRISRLATYGLSITLLLGCVDAKPSDERSVKMNEAGSSHDVASRGRKFAEKMGLVFPRSAQFSLADYEEGHDDNARLIVTMPLSDWDKLRRASVFAGATFSGDSNHHLGPDDPSGPWQFSDLAGLQTAQLSVGGGRESLNVGYAPAKNDMVTLYIFWFQL